MEILEIREKARCLALEGKYHISWEHIRKRGHTVSEFEIKMMLLHGRHEFDKEAEDRYLAFGNINNKNIRVVYEFILTQTGEHVLVVTAFAD
ncbi:MAG: hypothetical protein CO114_05430 [Euryarchaeota archaeon CG_4_9_14_3_um_filter_38_12]|nr:MAG: hypothetical protein CO114_05430 [Euryarchaeota archaeon CG_4_9_14_3_um_filter_38_12]